MKQFSFLLIFLGGFGLSMAQTSLFQEETPLELTLTADFTTFIADRSLKAEYYPAKISYVNGEEPIDIPLKIRVRGRFRRDSLICNFPPIRLNFKKGKLPQPFQDQDKLKLVTHCQDDETILKEYYVYKTYNLFTPRSFKVRLARITYVDEQGKIPTETHYAFMIESEEHMAKRNKSNPIPEEKTVRKNQVNQRMLAMVHLFNYMISNHDFDVTVRQNIKVISNGKSTPVAVPYDFDWAGIVAAPYTLQGNEDKHPYFLRRKFKRICLSQKDWEEIIDNFNDKKDQILELYQNSTYLAPESISESTKLYKNFYKHINRKKTIPKVLQNRCK